MNGTGPTNREIAEILVRVAELPEIQQASPFRVRACRRAADSVRRSVESLSQKLHHGGTDQLEQISGIGKSIAGSIREYVLTGRLGLLDRLRGEVSPEALFTRIPGMGETLAHRLTTELEITTLEELELAAWDGRLENIEGLGARKIRGMQSSLAAQLSRSGRWQARRLRNIDMVGQREFTDDRVQPSVQTIPDVDDEYRKKAESGSLPTIAARRFNPEGKAWLPILHTERGEWQFTALYPNTAQAHQPDKTTDWVVVYSEQDGHEDQITVVTKIQGPLKGKRVVRGRERACRDFYEKSSVS